MITFLRGIQRRHTEKSGISATPPPKNPRSVISVIFGIFVKIIIRYDLNKNTRIIINHEIFQIPLHAVWSRIFCWRYVIPTTRASIAVTFTTGVEFTTSQLLECRSSPYAGSSYFRRTIIKYQYYLFFDRIYRLA